MLFFVFIFYAFGLKVDMCTSDVYFPTHQVVRQALQKVVSEGMAGISPNGGFNLNMWATLVDRDGVVKVVAHSGEERGDQWPGSRVISAQKANTANAFSLPSFSLSTANLYSAVQPGGSLFGLQHSNPVDTRVAYGDPSLNDWIGTAHDPMVNKKIGGVNVFGGGLAMYNSQGILIGGLGVSGDSSCADHAIAWKLRHELGLDYLPGGPNPMRGDDNIVYDIGVNGVSLGGWGHPLCGDPETLMTISDGLPLKRM